MRVLITGGGGYVGSHVAALLAGGGADVTVFDNFVRGHHDAVRRASRIAGRTLTVIEGDLGDPRALIAALSGQPFDAVMHYAAFKSAPESVEHPEWYHRENVIGTRNLLDAMQECGLRKLVFASTGGVYGDGMGEPFDELAPLAPLNPYAETKVTGEHLLAALPKEFSYVAFRFFNVCGAHPSGELGEYPGRTTNLMPVLVGALDRPAPAITVFGTDWETRDGTCIRDYVHVSDIASGNAAALRVLMMRPLREVINLGTGRGSTVFEVIDAVEAASGCSINRVLGPRRAGDPAIVVARAHRAEQVLGWRSEYSLTDMATSAVRWHHHLRGAQP